MPVRHLLTAVRHIWDTRDTYGARRAAERRARRTDPAKLARFIEDSMSGWEKTAGYPPDIYPPDPNWPTVVRIAKTLEHSGQWDSVTPQENPGDSRGACIEIADTRGSYILWLEKDVCDRAMDWE